jgi:hypothetical protein
VADFTFIAKPTLEVSDSQKEVIADEAIEAIAKGRGVLSKSVAAAGTITLTADESRYGIILLTGAPAGATTVVQDVGVTTAILFRNDTTGGQVISVKANGGSTFVVPATASVLLLNGTKAILFGTDNTPSALGTAAAVGTSEELARADHQHQRDWVDLTFNAATVTWTNMPLLLTEFLGLTDRRRKFDLTNFTQARLVVNVEVIGAALSVLYCEFCTTDGGTYAALDNSTGPQCSLATAGTIVSAPVSLTAAAKADVFLRISGVTGDGVTDPDLGLITLQVR